MKYRIKMIFLTIITFGLIWIKWSKKIEHKKNTIYQVENIPFNIEAFFSLLGTKENIKKIDSKHSRIDIYFSDISKINKEQIQKLKGVSGIFVKSDTISVVLGVYTQSVFNALNNKEIK
ncbi:PTS sugar transporter subunit IIABC [Mycoplasma leonicaptivi]|uniref:PTS sugar transporter subunit IIABC n=1 Tax=Mycoplasma leonicaptivi TaxID=36742 RepID=UPI00055C52D6|nr:PTS sugar transporter subunit IIABC [Mycoplasma leonicaptivi]